MADGKVTIETDLDQSGAVGGMKKMGSTLGSMGSSLASGIGSIFKGTAVAIGAVGAAIGAVGASAISYNATMEQYATSFEVMTGSAEKSAEVMQKLKDLGASTPFEFEDLAGATQTLMAFGFSADEAIEQFSMLGDISQGDAQKLDTFSSSLGKMQSSGKVTLESLNMMIEQGFNPLQVISQKTGESMESLYDRVSKGAVSLDEIKDAMVTATSEGGQFYQSMDKQSQTLNGRISTLKDNFQQLTGAIFGSASTGAGDIINLAIDWVNQLQTAFTTGGTDAMIKALGDILAQAVTKAAEFAPQMINLAVSVIQSLVDGLTQNQQVLVDGAIAIGTALIGGILQIIPQLAGLALSLLYGLADAIIVSLPAIQSSGADILNGIMSGITSNISILMGMASNIIMSLLQGIVINAPSLLAAAGQILGTLVSGIASSLPTLVPAAIAAIMTLVDGILNNLPAIIDTGLQLIISLAMGLINALPQLIAAIPTIIIGLVNALVAAAPKIGEAAIKLIFELAKALVLAIPDLVVAVGKIVVGLVAAFGNYLSNWQSVGKNIVDGIWEGIKAGWDWLTGKISDLASGLLDAAKNVLGINSPSKEFAWIGEMSADGMALGFEDSDPTQSIKDTIVAGTKGISMGINSYVTGNVSGTNGLGEMIVDAISNSNMTVKIGSKEMGRIVRGYA